MLYDYIIKAYSKLYNTTKLPVGLSFRLRNIGARAVIFKEFIQYFDLKNEFEALKFILDDKNLEEIMRYTLENQVDDESIIYYSPFPRGYDIDASKEHRDIDRYTNKEEKEYLGKK